MSFDREASDTFSKVTLVQYLNEASVNTSARIESNAWGNRVSFPLAAMKESLDLSCANDAFVMKTSSSRAAQIPGSGLFSRPTKRLLIQRTHTRGSKSLCALNQDLTTSWSCDIFLEFEDTSSSPGSYFHFGREVNVSVSEKPQAR